MGGDKVHAGPRPSAQVIKHVGRGRQALGDVADRRLAAPEIAHGVAVTIIPFGPARRKLADLITAGTHIPGFGDQLYGTQHRVLITGLQEAALIVETIRLAGEDGTQIEAKAIDVQFVDPVAQAVGDHLNHRGVREVQGVAGAGIVDVIALVRQQPIVGGVVDAL